MTAAAFSGVPSLKRMPRRMRIVTVRLSAEIAGQRGGELRHDLEPRVQVVELLAHVQEDHAADEGARKRRVERVRILGERDDERAARLARSRAWSGRSRRS